MTPDEGGAFLTQYLKIGASTEPSQSLGLRNNGNYGLTREIDFS
jgi:hypothetical protein